MQTLLKDLKAFAAQFGVKATHPALVAQLKTVAAKNTMLASELTDKKRAQVEASRLHALQMLFARVLWLSSHASHLHHCLSLKEFADGLGAKFPVLKDAKPAKLEAYCAALKPRQELAPVSDIVHFKAKLTHSGASGAVFISPKRVSKLPLLFSASLQNDQPLPVDTNALTDARVALAVDAINNALGYSTAEKVKKLPPDADCDALYDRHMAQPTRVEAPHGIDPRLRQILVPMADAQYAALTVLSAGGIRARIDQQYGKAYLGVLRAEIKEARTHITALTKELDKLPAQIAVAEQKAAQARNQVMVEQQALDERYSPVKQKVLDNATANMMTLAGEAKALNQRFFEAERKLKEFKTELPKLQHRLMREPDEVTMPIGGSQSHNVGRVPYGPAFQQAYLYDVPESRLRPAKAARGLALPLPTALIKSYADQVNQGGEALVALKPLGDFVLAKLGRMQAKLQSPQWQARMAYRTRLLPWVCEIRDGKLAATTLCGLVAHLVAQLTLADAAQAGDLHDALLNQIQAGLLHRTLEAA